MNYLNFLILFSYELDNKISTSSKQKNTKSHFFHKVHTLEELILTQIDISIKKKVKKWIYA